MATAAPPPKPAPRAINRVHLFRLLTLTIDEGTSIVRNIFDDKRPNDPLDVFLAREKTTIKQLRQKKTITQSQHDLLFPQIGTPATADFDLTLSICLLRNLKAFVLNPNFSWNAIPQPGDTSVEADLRRLQIMRNELAHISVTTGISESAFKIKWSDSENVLLRLNASIQNPDPNLQQRIDECINRPLDPGALKGIEQSVENLQILINSEVENLRTNLDNLNSKTDEQFQEISKNIQKLKTNQEKRASSEGVLRNPDEYLQAGKHLKEDLITLYRDQYHTLPLSPLFEKHDTPLVNFYVMPDIISVEKGKKSNVSTLHDVFGNNTKMHQNIYLIADAGYGKTALSKRLALTWCQALERIKDETKCFEEDEIEAMSAFEFVFLLSLRDSSEECDIDQMILKQIIPLVAHTSCIDLQVIETVLTEHKCLVIMDGLDEWEHTTSCSCGNSGVPRRKARRKCSVLTTTRPWKLSVIELKSSQIDLKLELKGLSEKSRTKLKKSVISLSGHKLHEAMDDQIEAFNAIVDRKGISDLETVPLLLMYLLCLWCDETDLGQSKCEIYCQIIELLLKRTFKKYPEMQNRCARLTSDIPHCFSSQKNCSENYTFLSSLGQLAFETLFSKTRENTLIFDSLFVKTFLNSAFLDLSLLSGIITQDKVSKLTSEQQKSSFSHKTVQEFFAALYISTCSDQDEVLHQVFSICNSSEDILEMSKVLTFVCGFNTKLFSLVSEKLMEVIKEDGITSTYRTATWPLFFKNEHTMKQIQDMYISCLEEIPENTDSKLCLQDFFVDKACLQRNYYRLLQKLILQNKINIRSINIKIEGTENLSDIITKCKLSDPDITCQKIYYRGECKEAELIKLLSRPVECATIVSHEWRNNHFKSKVGSWNHELSEIFKNNNQLQAINIQCFNFSHDVLETFLNYLAESRTSMKEIALFNLFCTDSRTSCPGFNFDLSRHTHLIRLGLNNVPLSQLNVNVSLLEECYVGTFPKNDIVNSYLSDISAASKLHTFKCGSLNSSGDIQKLLKTLSLLVQVKDVRLYEMDLGESLLPHEIVNTEYVLLSGVKIRSSSLRILVCWIENLTQQVTVEMYGCNVTPNIEFEDIKEYIQRSETLLVVRDGTIDDGKYRFAFKSMK